MNKLSVEDFYYCYDVKLSKFLKELGIQYLLKAKSCKENKIFTVYHRNKEFHNAMHMYKLRELNHV